MIDCLVGGESGAVDPWTQVVGNCPGDIGVPTAVGKIILVKSNRFIFTAEKLRIDLATGPVWSNDRAHRLVVADAIGVESCDLDYTIGLMLTREIPG